MLFQMDEKKTSSLYKSYNVLFTCTSNYFEALTLQNANDNLMQLHMSLIRSGFLKLFVAVWKYCHRLHDLIEKVLFYFDVKNVFVDI